MANRVVYTSCSLGNLINSAGWEEWSSSTPNTDHVTFAEYASTGTMLLFLAGLVLTFSFQGPAPLVLVHHLLPR